MQLTNKYLNDSNALMSFTGVQCVTAICPTITRDVISHNNWNDDLKYKQFALIYRSHIKIFTKQINKYSTDTETELNVDEFHVV